MEDEFSRIKTEIQQILQAEGLVHSPEIDSTWENGEIQFLPNRPEFQSKEISVKAFFHKIVMIRDKLRLIEQTINANPKLLDSEKVQLEQYVTRVYEALVAFNQMFS